MLILAGVSIATLTGDNGLLTKAEESKKVTEKNALREEIELRLIQAQMGEKLEDIFKDGTVVKDGAVYEVSYKGISFLVSSDYDYIEKVETDVNEWGFDESTGTIGPYKGDLNTKRGNQEIGEVIIPNYYNGKRVKKIGFRVFKDKTVKKLTISNGIEEIVYLGFQYGLSELEGDLIIPDSMTFLPDGGAFSGCGANGELKLSNNLKKIGNKAFEGCKNLKGDLIIPDSVEEIGANAFSGCSSLDGKLKISGNIKTIEDRAFMNCSNLKGDVVLPSSLEFLGWQAFNGCKGINSVTFLNKDTIIDVEGLHSIRVIKGYANSTAETYARENNKTFELITQ